MRLATFLLRRAGKTLLLAVVAGVVSGAANSGLLALMNAGLKSEGTAKTTLLWWSIGLCIILPLSRCISELRVNMIGQDALYDLRLKLCHQILGAPLARLET